MGIKHHFFTAFREFFVYHHSSLKFRAKIFALFIATNHNFHDEGCEIIKKFGLKTYKNDEYRANLLMLSTQELVSKVKEDNGLNIDTLITNIQQELKNTPRYAKKIDLDALEPILFLTKDRDTISYQQNIVEFLQNLKADTLNTKKTQIKIDEENIESIYDTKE